MLLLVGLGNPGPENQRHRHNVGYMAIDTIAARHGFPAFRSRFKSLISEASLGGEKVMLLKPMTYMNLSGEAVGEALRYFKLDAADLLVVHDELDLVLAKAKIKIGGGHAGHNGLRSIDGHLGTPNYRRLRLGIGHPGDKRLVHKWVLSDFAKADRPRLEILLDAIAASAEYLVGHDDAKFLNNIAMALNADKTTPQRKDGKQTGPQEINVTAPRKTGLAAAFESALSRLRGNG